MGLVEIQYHGSNRNNREGAFYNFIVWVKNLVLWFLVADKQLLKALSVCQFIHRSVSTSRKVEKHEFPSLPTRPQLVLAVYPTLF